MQTVTEDAGAGLPRPAPAVSRRRRIRIGAVVAVALAVGFVLWLVLRGGDSSSSTTPTVPTTSNPVPISITGLQRLGALGIPIYWAGEKSGATYEMTKTGDNRVFIRYLASGEKVGTKSPHLTIGTYPMKRAYAVTARLARSAGSVSIPIGHGGIAFYSRARPTNVYLAYPGSTTQVEVYDPSPGVVQQLVFSGRIIPVADGAWTKPSLPKAESASTLRTLAASLGHAVYWAQPMPGATYELTRPWNGNVFLRYLPRGVAVGTKKPYLTIATYPVLDAFAAVRRTATSGASTIPIPGGGLAVVDERDPRSVHLAYPNSDYQIEVFDPSPARARFIASHRVAPIG